MKSRTPPIGKRFGSGQRGNPGGRPKALAEVVELARKHTPQAIAALVGIMNTPVDGTTGMSDSARVAAANAILDRAWGKAPQEIRVEQEMPLDSRIVPAAASLVADGLSLVGREIHMLKLKASLGPDERKLLVDLVKAKLLLIHEDERQMSKLDDVSEAEIEAEAKRLMAPKETA